MSEWREVALGDVIELKRGYDLPSVERRPGSVPIISSSGESGLHCEAKVKGPGVVTGRYGTIGEVFLVKSDFWPLNTSLYVRDFKGNDVRFVYYLLKTINWAQYNDKSGVPGINRNHVHEAKVKVPETGEQKAIAHVLGALDEKIQRNRLENATLEDLARAVFKNWFVDFGPVIAKNEGREPPALSTEIADLFPEGFDAHGTPHGWEVGSLRDLASLNPESWSKKNSPEAILYVDLANTKWGAIECTTKYSWGDAPSRAQRVLRPGDTIVGTVRPGNGSYSFVNSDGMTGSTGFAVLRPKLPDNREMVYLAATSRENIERLAHQADGGAYPAVRPEKVIETEVVIPPPKLITAFSKFVSPMLNTIEQNKLESHALASLRDLLIPKLLSGEVRIQDAEKVAGAAL